MVSNIFDFHPQPAWEPCPSASFAHSICPSRELWTKASNCMFSKDSIFCSGKEAMFPSTVAAWGKQEYTEKFDSYLHLVQVPLRPTQRRRGMQRQRLQSLWHPGPGTCTMARSNSHNCFDGSFATIWGPHSATARWNPLWGTSCGALQRVRAPPPCYVHSYFVRASGDRSETQSG